MGNFVFSTLADFRHFGIRVSLICIKWTTSYIYLIFRKRSSRMTTYNLKLKGMPYKVGFFTPEQEWKLECLSIDQAIDAMFCFGVNSSGECLAVQIVRGCSCDYSSSLFLRIDGYSYTLPKKFSYLKFEDGKTFGSSRFFMQCVAPFRKWRIFFNGLLREISPDRKCERIVHVKFSFIWTASSYVFDFMEDLLNTSMADMLSEMNWNGLTPPVDKLLDTLNEYHQPGMLLGIVKVRGMSEHGVLLWGCRRHTFWVSKESCCKHCLTLFANAENGLFLFFKMFSIKSISKRNMCGYIMQPDGFIKAARILNVEKSIRCRETVLAIKFKAGGCLYNVCAFFYGSGLNFERGVGAKSSIGITDILVNGFWGGGIAIESHCAKSYVHQSKCRGIYSILHSLLDVPHESIYVLTLHESLCLDSNLTGNLGYALGKVKQLQGDIDNYDVVDAVIVTIHSYEEFMHNVWESVELLQENIWKYDAKERKQLCERIVEEVSNSYLPEDIFESLCYKLNFILAENEICKFVVQPSIKGIVSEVVPFEKQLISYRNVIGLPAVIRAVKKCWASQFSYAAIETKRYTGQCISMPMAVIVQKMVSCKTSGIISTCDPHTGDPSLIEIQENVQQSDLKVASRIITLGIRSERYFEVKNIFVVPKKDDNSSYEENLENLIEENCLTKFDAVMLGKVAFELEKLFLYPLCIKWSVWRKRFLLLKVHPIILNMETVFETVHHSDTHFRTEEEWITTFISGNVPFGPMSPLGMDILNRCFDISFAQAKCVNLHEKQFPVAPYFPNCFMTCYGHLMYCMVGGLPHFSEDILMKSLLTVLYGKDFDYSDLITLSEDRYGKYRLSLCTILHGLKVLLFPNWRPHLLKGKMYNYEIPLHKFKTASSMLEHLSYRYHDICESLACYTDCTFAASVWGTIVLYILAMCRSGKGYWYKDIHRDFCILMSACNESQNEDPPCAIKKLASRIAKCIQPEVFKGMKVKEVREWLEEPSIDQKVKYSWFMEKYGHRCWKEVDIYQKCWSMDPDPLIRVLQNLVGTVVAEPKNVSHLLDNLFCQLSIKPNFLYRLLLKFVLRKSVASLREREICKCGLMRIASVWREAFHKIAETAVQEFRLPSPDYLFFLNLEDVNQLLKTPAPFLVAKAVNHHDLFTVQEKYLFPGITIGIPTSIDLATFAKRRLGIGSSIKGIPISRGTAVGTAVVAMKLKGIGNIKKGAILITRNADIAWSFYFPMLGGFAVDLGGVLSDSIILAQEYGLPCVTNLIHASLVVHTGDRIFLDGNKGFLRRIPDA